MSKSPLDIYPHHVLIWVDDMSRALDFYTRILGLPKINESPRFSEVGGTRYSVSLHLTDTRIQRDIHSAPILVFHSANVDGTHAELLKRGVKEIRGPFWAAPNVRVAEFIDSEGNRFSISSAQ